ncbi:hypothetical protein H9L39_04924 [Fusarium oxysporum f. sp. albedinis]|nr:hypothetical protein H9L39_04924 [Fusarium oxysporum f. sp. albedinis]
MNSHGDALKTDSQQLTNRGNRGPFAGRQSLWLALLLVTETFEASSFNALCPFHARGSIPSAGRVSVNTLLSYSTHSIP